MLRIMKSRHTTQGRVIIDGITHKVYAVNSVGVGGTTCNKGFSQRSNAERRGMAYGQRTSHGAAVNCMACIAKGTDEPAEQGILKVQRWPKPDKTPWWLVFDKEARKLR